jgi:signal recognition particle subunit SRP68
MNITTFVVTHRDNALLIGDYKTYHHQLTKQLASLRKKLGRATPKNAKFSKKAAITAEDIGRNNEYAYPPTRGRGASGTEARERRC